MAPKADGSTQIQRLVRLRESYFYAQQRNHDLPCQTPQNNWPLVSYPALTAFDTVMMGRRYTLTIDYELKMTKNC